MTIKNSREIVSVQALKSFHENGSAGRGGMVRNGLILTLTRGRAEELAKLGFVRFVEETKSIDPVIETKSVARRINRTADGLDDEPKSDAIRGGSRSDGKRRR